MSNAVKAAGSYQDGNTSSRVIPEDKHLQLNQFSDGLNLLGSGIPGAD